MNSSWFPKPGVSKQPRTVQNGGARGIIRVRTYRSNEGLDLPIGPAAQALNLPLPANGNSPTGNGPPSAAP